jgi:hypothetical protein
VITGNKYLLVLITVALVCPTLTVRLRAEGSTDGETDQRISHIAEQLCVRLQMKAKIDVIIADENKFGVSVEPEPDGEGRYALSFDRRLYESFSNDELIAAVAHEMGHVWIYTHHPYLQTEALANEIALRVVSRETMTRVYSKLWSRLGISGNLEEVLGPDPHEVGAGNTAATRP